MRADRFALVAASTARRRFALTGTAFAIMTLLLIANASDAGAGSDAVARDGAVAARGVTEPESRHDRSARVALDRRTEREPRHTEAAGRDAARARKRKERKENRERGSARRARTGQRASGAIALPVDSVAESRLRTELGPHFAVRRTDHYRIAYDADPVIVGFHARLFEAVHESFRDFFEASGFVLPRLERRLEAVMFAERDAFNAYASHIRPGLEAAGGFYSTRENRIVLFDSFTDGTYRESSERLAAAERNVVDVRTQLAAGRRGDLVTLTYSDGRSISLARKEALALVRAKERELRAKRRELENHFADRNLTTTIHECVHQLSYNLGVQSLTADNPRWLGEGLATYFETMGYRNAGADGLRNPERFDAWRRARRDGSLIALERLILDDGVFDVASERASTAYGQAWALVHYLFEERPAQLFDYLRRTAATPRRSDRAGQSRLKIFRAAFGDDLDAFERRWHRYMSRL